MLPLLVFAAVATSVGEKRGGEPVTVGSGSDGIRLGACLLYTSDAADEEDNV